MGVSGQNVLLIFVAVLSLLLGRAWGQTRERRRSASAKMTAVDLLNLAEAVEANADYAVGFRAGHLQGWQDAVAVTGGGGPVRLPPPALDPVAVERYAPAGPLAPGLRPHPFQPPFSSVGAPPSPAWQKPVLTAATPETGEEAAARKEKRDRQNINITLYIASLLLVAAGSLFIGAALPEGLRFAGICAITAVFYLGGLVLHAKAPRLRPAAVAFTGTGLALVPVAGLAMYNLAINDADAAWLITSLIGTIAYVTAVVASGLPQTADGPSSLPGSGRSN